MALLQRTRALADQRIDLVDFNNIESFVAADLNAIHKYNWTSDNYVMNGFVATGVGTNTLSVGLAGSTALFGADAGTLFIGAPSLSALQTASLTPGVRNYVELKINQDSGGADSRSFWDQTAAAGLGGEFSQIVDTFIFLNAAFATNTSNFTSDLDKVPLCQVDVDVNGLITKIIDSRPLFFRLGRPNNAAYAFNWTNGRAAEDTANPSYQDPDKHIGNIKSMLDALMDSIREIKGTVYWYQPPFASLVTSFQNTALSTISAVNATSKFSWNGTQLSLTDGSGAPSSADPIAYIRLFNSVANLVLRRQTVSLTDGDVLWVEIPKPTVSTNYSGTGSSASNFRISPRGAVPLSEATYWIAYCEGTKIFLRGFGELEIGESVRVGDTYSEALQTFLGFNPETASSVPYTFYPNSLYFGNLYSSASSLVQAISVNTANINALGIMLDENAYEETLEVVASSPTSGQIVGPLLSGSTQTLPLDSRDALSAQQYIVGDGILHLYHDGQFLARGKDWAEIGSTGALSSTIQLLRTIGVGELLTYRMDSLGGFNVGAAGGGGDVTGAQNLGGGEGELYVSKSAGDLLLRTIKAGAGISVVQVGNQIIVSITGGSPTPYARTNITGQTSTVIGTGAPYNLGTDKLEVYRNGQLIMNTTTLGSVDERYQEGTSTSVVLDGTSTVTAPEVFSFVNYAVSVGYKTLMTGLTGTVLTIPSYNMGDDSLRIYRNGVLMNSVGYGNAVDQYTETSGTTITLGQAATSGEIFTAISGPVPADRIERTGLSGTSITLTSSYVMGAGKLLVFRNGILMFASNTLGNPPDRYTETSSNSISLATAAIPSEVFSFIFVA